VRRLGLNGNMPCPFVVVHSGKTTMTLPGLLAIKIFRSTSFAPLDGISAGYERARSIAPNREMTSTWRIFGYETVNMGSNMAARYRESMGDVKEDAMMSEGPGTRPSCFFANEPFLTPSIWRSIHHMPGIPNIIHNIAFLNRDPRGNHCRKRKYVVVIVTKNGNLKRKRKTWTGR